MPNAQYRRGARIEYIIKKIYEDDGYTVFRSAGSHGPADLVAVNGKSVLFIQIKSITADDFVGTERTKAIELLKSMDVPPKYSRKLIVVWKLGKGIHETIKVD